MVVFSSRDEEKTSSTLRLKGSFINKYLAAL